MNVIDVQGVSKCFRIPSVRRETVREHLLGFLSPRVFHRLAVLDSVSFRVKGGETIGIIGRNGSGKSTLLKVICGIYAPDSGVVAVHAPITAVLELGTGWNPELDAIDNILLIGTVMGLPLGTTRRAVCEILAFAGVEEFAHLELKHFSSGMAARLAYSVAFHAVSDVLVLDEVFAVGDAAFRARCEDRYRMLSARGCTVIVVTHDPRIARDFCDRVLWLENGRIAADGSGDAVVEAYYRSTVEHSAVRGETSTSR
jgi:ABC-type polysaccharide/polyol phosphate transport system ATPase subunit